MRIFRMRTWWQASLVWGVSMLVLNIFKNMGNGQLALDHLGKEVMIWAAAGLAFGLLLTAVLSLISHKNLFRSGFSEKVGNR